MEHAEHELLNLKKDYYLMLKRMTPMIYGIEHQAKELRILVDMEMKQFEKKHNIHLEAPYDSGGIPKPSRKEIQGDSAS
jgi:hypothetical protein